MKKRNLIKYIVFGIMLFTIIILSSCNNKCPAYAKSNTEKVDK